MILLQILQWLLLRPHQPRNLDKVVVEHWETAVIAFRMFSAAIVGLLLSSDASAEALVLNIASASTKQDPATSGPVLAIELDQGSKKDFAAFTSAHVGGKIELRFDGKVLAEPVIREPVTGGSLYISDPDWTNVMASDLAKQISRLGARMEVISK
jgi:preprotein translocase subunit SecD